MAPGSTRDDPVLGLVPCFVPPRVLQSGASFYRILSAASDAPVRSTWFSPGRSSPGARAVLHSAPDAPILGVFFVVFSPLPRTLQSVAPGSPPDDPVRGLVPCFIPPRMLQSGASFYRILSLPRMLQSVALGSTPGAPVWGLVPCFTPPWMLQSGASFYRILSVASDAPVPGTGFTPGRSSPGASAVLHSAPDAPIRGVFLSYSLRCLGRSSPWHQVHPRTI